MGDLLQYFVDPTDSRLSSDIGNLMSGFLGIDQGTKNALGNFLPDPTPGDAPPSSSAAAAGATGGTGNIFTAIANFFSINTGLRLVVVILGVGFIIIALIAFLQNSPTVQQVVATTAKTAALAA